MIFFNKKGLKRVKKGLRFYVKGEVFRVILVSGSAKIVTTINKNDHRIKMK